jgi:cytochrome b pre-mRNA-processing protein 3
MIFPLFRRSKRDGTISALYGTIVAQARMASFYRDFAVPDTPSGRFELIVLHLTLLIERLNTDSGLRELGQAVFDRFCQDMDDNLREMGVGDLAVPKHMRRMGEAFYGRAQAYRTALAAADPEALASVLARNIYEAAAPSGKASRLAAYVRDAVRDLAAQSAGDLAAGRLHFPDPAAAAIIAD